MPLSARTIPGDAGIDPSASLDVELSTVKVAEVMLVAYQARMTLHRTDHRRRSTAPPSSPNDAGVAPGIAGYWTSTAPAWMKRWTCSLSEARSWAGVP